MNNRRLRGLFAGMLFSLVLAAPGAALAADEDYVGGDNKVRGNNLGRPQPAADGDGDGESRGLPITGGDIVGLTVVGAAAVGVGSVLTRTSRRRRARS